MIPDPGDKVRQKGILYIMTIYGRRATEVRSPGYRGPVAGVPRSGRRATEVRSPGYRGPVVGATEVRSPDDRGVGMISPTPGITIRIRGFNT
jgi:hypothetical protein